MRTLRVDIYSDVVCPWCFVGVRRLERAMASQGAGDASLRFHPYLLHPDAPPEGIDLREMLARKYGGDPERMFERVERAAAESGIALDFSRVSRTYSTVGAHTLLRHAASRRTQPALAGALHSAYFLEGHNVADPAVLVELAAAHGFTSADAEQLLADEAERLQTVDDARQAARLGIRGVPFFLFDERYALSGAQPPEVFERAIAAARTGEQA